MPYLQILYFPQTSFYKESLQESQCQGQGLSHRDAINHLLFLFNYLQLNSQFIHFNHLSNHYLLMLMKIFDYSIELDTWEQH